MKHLRRYCANSGESTKNINFSLLHPTNSIFIDEKHKILFCGIPKAGTTSWKVLLMKIASNKTKIFGRPHKLSNNRKHGIESLSRIKHQGALSMQLHKYYKIIAVRHPFLRLVSAYRNKFIDEKPNRRINNELLKRYHPWNSEVAPINAMRATWEQFARYIAEDTEVRQDKHWEHFHKVCHSCVIKYDAVAKLDTIEKDTHEFLARLGLARLLKIEHRNKSIGNNKTTNARDYTERLSNDIMTRLKAVMKKDMDMFGYMFDSENQPICKYGMAVNDKTKEGLVEGFPDQNFKWIKNCC